MYNFLLGLLLVFFVAVVADCDLCFFMAFAPCELDAAFRFILRVILGGVTTVGREGDMFGSVG